MASQHENSLHGKVILVTGAAAGIGLHAVTGLLAEGAKVVMVESTTRDCKAKWKICGEYRAVTACWHCAATSATTIC
jgi:NAD(P)-dependent dehydrogenase (short-subunit alcohol dehydrogenase family)